MGSSKLRTGLGVLLTAVGVVLFIRAFLSAEGVLGRGLGLGELFSNAIALGVMFAIAAFLTTKGAAMLR